MPTKYELMTPAIANNDRQGNKILVDDVASQNLYQTATVYALGTDRSRLKLEKVYLYMHRSCKPGGIIETEFFD